MYFKYFLALPMLAALTLLFWLLLHWPIEWAAAAGGLVFLLFVPAIFRHSRVLWIYFDRAVDAGD